jgi:hypothetical protein
MLRGAFTVGMQAKLSGENGVEHQGHALIGAGAKRLV